MILRPYQDKAVRRIRVALRSREPVLFVLPTGGGKTVVFSWITKRVQGKAKRVLIMAHRREIVYQISKALRETSVRHGMIMPGCTLTPDPVSVGMVQTVARRLGTLPDYDLIIIDEAHHSAAGTWDRVLKHYSKSFKLGVTATPERLDGKGLNTHFTKMILGPTARELIDGGYLSQFRYLAPPNALDMSEVRSRMGDYAKDDAKRAVDKPTITGDAVDHYEKYLNGAPVIVFCVDLEHAGHVVDAYTMRGWRADVIEGSQDPGVRAQRVQDLASGKLNVLVSCEVVSEGFDLPVVAGAQLLRPTKSLVMYLQQVGRALRPVYKSDMPLSTPEERLEAIKQGPKPYAVILDHVGNVVNHGPPDMDRDWALAGRPKTSKASPDGVRTCTKCYRVFRVGERVEGCVAPDECPLMNSEGRVLPAQVSGELEDLNGGDWTGGISIATAQGEEFKALVERADTLPKLREVAKARNFRRGWSTHVWRGKKRAEERERGQGS